MSTEICGWKFEKKKDIHMVSKYPLLVTKRKSNFTMEKLGGHLLTKMNISNKT